MGKRFSDEERAVLSRLLDEDDDDEDQADEDQADEDEEPDEFVHRGKRYRHVPDEPEPEPAKPTKKAAPTKKAVKDPEPEPAPRRRRFVS